MRQENCTQTELVHAVGGCIYSSTNTHIQINCGKPKVEGQGGWGNGVQED